MFSPTKIEILHQIETIETVQQLEGKKTQNNHKEPPFLYTSQGEEVEEGGWEKGIFSLLLVLSLQSC